MKRYEHRNNTRNLSLCVTGSTVQASNYTDSSRIYTVQPLLRSHKNLLTKTASRSSQTVWQPINRIDRRIARWSSTFQKESDACPSCADKHASTTWSSVQQSVLALMERSERSQALLVDPTSAFLTSSSGSLGPASNFCTTYSTAQLPAHNANKRLLPQQRTHQ